MNLGTSKLKITRPRLRGTAGEVALALAAVALLISAYALWRMPGEMK